MRTSLGRKAVVMLAWSPSAWRRPLLVGLCLGAASLPAAMDDWTPAHVKAAGHADNSLLALGVLDVTLYNAQNIRVFAVKVENRNCGVLRIRDSRNILVVGHGGHSIVADGVAAFDVANSRDVVLAVLGSSRYNPKGWMVCETGIEADARCLPQAGVVGLYKRGEFQEVKWLELTQQ